MGLRRRLGVGFHVCALLMGWAASCAEKPEDVPPVMMKFEMGRLASCPTMKLGSVTLVFEDVLDQGPDTTAPSATIDLQVAGGAPKEGVQTTWDLPPIKVSTAYAGGLQTVTVEGASFKIVERGKKLEFRDRVMPVEGEDRTVFVSGDGSTRLQP